MSYGLSDPKVFDEQAIRINKEIEICRKVVETIQTSGWQEIIAPLIDRMIMDVVGNKIGNKWVGGLLDKARKDERREYYVGYKQALIDLHNRIYAHETQIKIKEDQVKQLSDLKKKGFKQPLVDDTKYNLKESV